MKKLIALTLMVACLGCFSMGCKPKAPEQTAPAEPTAENTETPAAPATPAPEAE